MKLQVCLIHRYSIKNQPLRICGLLFRENDDILRTIIDHKLFKRIRINALSGK